MSLLSRKEKNAGNLRFFFKKIEQYKKLLKTIFHGKKNQCIIWTVSNIHTQFSFLCIPFKSLSLYVFIFYGKGLETGTGSLFI